MDQKSKTQLVQEKIKQMLQSRKRIVSKQNPSQTKRLKSNHAPSQTNQQLIQENQKPKSSIRMRPQTSQKQKSSQAHSVTTDSSNKNEVNPRSLVIDAFDRGFELSRYLNRKNLEADECKQKLLQNSLFLTLIISRVSKASEQQYQSIVQKQIITKLQKINLIKRQQKNCQFLQQKISLLIDQRLRSLTQS